MVAYVVATMTIHDPATYRKYTALTPALIAKHGGRFLTRGSEVTTIEGEKFEKRMVILEYPDKASAEALFADPEYVAAAKYRWESSTTTVVVQEGPVDGGAPDPNV